MKKLIPILLYSFLFFNTSAQGDLIIQSGTEVIIGNNTNLVLRDFNIDNEGTFDALNTGATVTLSGSDNVYLHSFEYPVFYNLKVNKTNNGSLILETDILVENNIDLNDGRLNLNGYSITLDGGQIVNEDYQNFIYGNAGKIEYTTILNSPNAVNPGNLGIEITSAKNLGQTTIRRSHEIQMGESGGEGIKRYFDINPTNNSDLSATLRMYYYDHELNSIPESELGFYRSEDNGTSWEWSAFDILNAAENFIEKSNIDAFSRWTIGSETTSPLPVELGRFVGAAKPDFNLLEWTTLSESNVSHFELQKLKSNTWLTIGRVGAAGFSDMENNYRYEDRAFRSEAYYRLRTVDFDATESFSEVVYISRSEGSKEPFTVYPNPMSNILTIQAKGLDLVTLYDASGREVLRQTSNFQEVDVSDLPTGLYILLAKFDRRFITQKITK